MRPRVKIAGSLLTALLLAACEGTGHPEPVQARSSGETAREGATGAADEARSGQAPAAPANAPASAPAVSEMRYELRIGREVYQHYCQTCHGDSGAGDGFNAFNLDPHPRDLSDPAFQKAKSPADLADAVRRGGAGVGLSPLMPPWANTLTPMQIDDVVLYIRTFRHAPQS